jgi:putative hydrolase of the HAD superfamily
MIGPALLSDIGNVLVSFDFSIAAERCARHCPYPASALFNKLDNIKLPYENGEISDDVFVSKAIRALEFQGSQEQFIEIWCEIFQENMQMENTLARFHGTLPMFLLSNTSGLHKRHLFASYSIFRHFQDGIYSYSAGCSKPGKQIFEVAINSLGLDPCNTFYVDDLEANLETAMNMGFHTHLYQMGDHAAFEQGFAAWLLSRGVI